MPDVKIPAMSNGLVGNGLMPFAKTDMSSVMAPADKVALLQTLRSLEVTVDDLKSARGIVDKTLARIEDAGVPKGLADAQTFLTDVRNLLKHEIPRVYGETLRVLAEKCADQGVDPLSVLHAAAGKT